jgi:hypothetical protein
MSFFENSLVGRRIDCVHVDSEVTYMMLSDGTHVTIRGLVVVEPRRAADSEPAPHAIESGA